jgi:hypothetical protein
VKRPWLKDFTWPVIVETNRQLCLPTAALHKPTSGGYTPARQLWELNHRSSMSLTEAVDLCRRCHLIAPFCNFNGNTFVAVIRRAVSVLRLAPDEAVLLRSLCGHIVAGIATPEEERALTQTIARLEQSSA